MHDAPVTASPLFRARCVRSELRGAWLLAGLWAFAGVTTLARRAAGDAITSRDSVFYSALGLVAVALTLQALTIRDARRRLARGEGPSLARSAFGAAADLALPLAAMGVVQWSSPPGTFTALSGPVILLLPLVVALSVLRLNPRLSLAVGVAAGVAHWALCVLAVRHAPPAVGPAPWAMLLTYGLYLIVMGVAAAFIAHQARSHVNDAVTDALAAAGARQALASLEHDLEVARQIQMGLLPSATPELPGFEIAGMARPAQQTGGDYYDWQPMPGGRLAVALADVTGHGIGPALVMAVCRAYARSAAEGAADPSEILRRVNGLIYEDLTSAGRFITMAVAILGPDGRVDLVSAGHGPTLLYRASTGEVERFGGDGVPLGVLPDETYAPHQALHLGPGDALLLLTDGFMEWARAGDGEQFGVDRLCAALRGSGRGSARAILDDLDAEVGRFAAGAPQLDDTTAVAILRHGTPTPTPAPAPPRADGPAGLDQGPIPAGGAHR